MYLTETEIEQLLGRIGDLSAPRGRLGFDRMSRPEREALGTGRSLDAVSDRAVRRIEVLRRSDTAASDAATRLTGHGWHVRAYDAAAQFARHGRPVPPLLDRTVPGAAVGWFVTATRGESPGQGSPQGNPGTADDEGTVRPRPDVGGE
jgi:O-methyltransferase involved in polyketide biosynthesis